MVVSFLTLSLQSIISQESFICKGEILVGFICVSQAYGELPLRRTNAGRAP